MASKHEENLSNSANCCESVFSAIFCCNCQTDEDVSDHEHKHKTEHEPIATIGQNIPIKTPKAEVAEKKHVQLPENVVTVSTRGSALKKSDTFTDYIHRAKLKIRTMSNIGQEKNFTEPDIVHGRDTKQENSLKDGFSEYINQAKKKMIRKTTGIGN